MSEFVRPKCVRCCKQVDAKRCEAKRCEAKREAPVKGPFWAQSSLQAPPCPQNVVFSSGHVLRPKTKLQTHSDVPHLKVQSSSGVKPSASPSQGAHAMASDVCWGGTSPSIECAEFVRPFASADHLSAS